MKKQTIKLEKYFSEIPFEIGQTVRLIDGSSLSLYEESKEDLYIVNSFEELTGSKKPLKALDAEVIETNVQDRAISSIGNNAYYQDLVIKIGHTKFRTASNMVTLVEKYDIGTIVKVISGGNGAYCADGRVGIICSEKEAITAHSYNGAIRGKSFINIKTNDAYFGLAEGYKIEKL